MAPWMFDVTMVVHRSTSRFFVRLVAWDSSLSADKEPTVGSVMKMYFSPREARRFANKIRQRDNITMTCQGWRPLRVHLTQEQSASLTALLDHVADRVQMMNEMSNDSQKGFR
jgi:hypothetical protein